MLTLLIGSAGGYAGYKSRVPAGSLIGALLFTTVFSMFSGRAEGLVVYRVVAQIIAGLFIGMQLAKCDMRSLARLWRPILIIMAGVLTINVFVGLLLHYAFGIDLTTALFATTPGGISEMSVISAEMGANTLQVSVLQFFRMLSGFLIFPPIAQRLTLHLRKKDTIVAREVEEAAGASETRGETSTALVIAAGALAGIAGHFTGISGGILVTTMLAVGMLGRLGKRAAIPRVVKRCAQTLSGTYIGATSTLADVESLKTLLLPTLVLVSMYLLLCLLLGFILYKACKLEPSEAFFSCIPAGVSDMALIASDVGAGGPTVAILQLFRFASAVAISPGMILLITHWLG